MLLCSQTRHWTLPWSPGTKRRAWNSKLGPYTTTCNSLCVRTPTLAHLPISRTPHKLLTDHERRHCMPNPSSSHIWKNCPHFRPPTSLKSRCTCVFARALPGCGDSLRSCCCLTIWFVELLLCRSRAKQRFAADPSVSPKGFDILRASGLLKSRSLTVCSLLYCPGIAGPISYTGLPSCIVVGRRTTWFALLAKATFVMRSSLLVYCVCLQIEPHTVSGGAHTVLEAWLHGKPAGDDAHARMQRRRHHKALKRVPLSEIRQLQREVCRAVSRCVESTHRHYIMLKDAYPSTLVLHPVLGVNSKPCPSPVRHVSGSRFCRPV